MVTMRWSLLVPILFAEALVAQSPRDLTGATVRLRSPHQAPLVGTVLAQRVDSIVIRARGGADRTVALATFTRVDSLLPGGNHAVKGAAIGGGLGVLAAIGFLSGFCGGDNLCDGDEEVRAFAIFALPPAALGALIGAAIKRERWAPIGAGLRSVTIQPTPGGVAVGLWLRW